EKGIANSFSCGLWGNCPEGAAPGIHLGDARGTGANSTAGLGGASTATQDSGVESQDQSPSFFGGDEEQVPEEDPAVQDPAVEDPAVEDPAVEDPAVEDPAAEPAPVEEAPVEDPAAEPAPVEEAPPE
nr:hypothetical protein [Actinomycetota bacterium]